MPRISELPELEYLDGTEQFVVVREGQNYRVPLQYQPPVAPEPDVPAPVYTVTPDTLMVVESGTVIFTVATTDFGDGELYWTLFGFNGFDSDDVTTGMSGTVTITGDVGQITVTTSGDLTEETVEYFYLELREDSISGPVLTQSKIVTLVNVPVPDVITPDKLYIPEGDTVTFSVNLLGFGTGTVYWTATGVAAADFEEDTLSGEIELTDDLGEFSLTTVRDRVKEGNETFRVQVRTVSIEGDIVGETPILTIVDPTYYVTPNVSTVEPGNTVTFTVTTTLFGDGTLDWGTINLANVSAYSFSDSKLEGTVTVTNDKGTITRQISPTSGEGSFRLALVDVNGAKLAESASVMIKKPYVPAPPPSPTPIPPQQQASTPVTFTVGDSMNLVIGELLF